MVWEELKLKIPEPKNEKKINITWGYKNNQHYTE